MTKLNTLPDEIILHVADYIRPHEVIALSITSKRFLFLTRDNNHWRQQCYHDSKAAARKRREELAAHQSSRIAALVRAVNDISAGQPAQRLNANYHQAHDNDRRRTGSVPINSRVSWDPSYPSETANFYQEYVHRHAPIRLSWFEHMNGRETERQDLREATGAGLLYDAEGRGSRLYAPLDNGSISVWDATAPTNIDDRSPASSGRKLGSSAADLLLADDKPMFSDGEGVVECVSIDSQQRRGYFAVANDLMEVDLSTLQVRSRHSFGWPIGALSEARPGAPITVGTTCDLHLFDTRQQHRASNIGATDQVNALGDVFAPPSIAHQLIHDPSPAARRSNLAQPGPLSILHLAKSHNSHSIWVAGRFTHLLNYDSRYFPRLTGTIHSGARVSSLTHLPYSYLPQTGKAGHQPKQMMDIDGTTLVAAGAYKGKGSLETYSFSQDLVHNDRFVDYAAAGAGSAFTMTNTGLKGVCAQNRQTASSSKLLSVANHGLKLAYSDGDAKIKWVERDGFTPIREMSVAPAVTHDADGFIDQGHEGQPELLNPSLWAHDPESNNGDIVQKLIPTLSTSALASNDYRPRLHEDNLIIWTGDGRLGMLGFGKHSGWDEEAWQERAEMAEEENARMQEEREHAGRMRRALQWQADEARFMQGMGLPFAQSW